MVTVAGFLNHQQYFSPQKKQNSLFVFLQAEIRRKNDEMKMKLAEVLVRNLKGATGFGGYLKP